MVHFSTWEGISKLAPERATRTKKETDKSNLNSMETYGGDLTYRSIALGLGMLIYRVKEEGFMCRGRPGGRGEMQDHRVHNGARTDVQVLLLE